MGSVTTAITFSYFLADNERYNPLDYFVMGIIEGIRFFSFDVEDPACNQKLCADMMRKIEKQGVWIVKRKRLKFTYGIHGNI